jgi:streptomycin 3"-adenylyltransferase
VHNPSGLSSADKQQLNHVQALVHRVLNSDAAGAYLFGSAVFGGLQPASDLDILVVSRRPTTLAEKRRIVRDLMATSDVRTSEGPLRRIELTIVVERDVRPWHYPPRLDFQYGDWLRDEFSSGNAEVWSSTAKPDLAVLIAMVLLADTPLFGPRPSQVFDPVPKEDLVRAMVSDVDRLRGDIAWDTGNVALTLARIWSTCETGVIRSKDAAAEWALDRLAGPHRAVLARAREIYLGEQAERWQDMQTEVASLVDYLIGKVRSLAAGSDEHS